ncbi:MAG: hypothetical protein AAF674_21065 [Pseudomonadota bacterium]
MLLARTISQLDVGPLTPEEADELGQLGYVQWLAGLPGNSNFEKEAMRAYSTALPFLRTSPAIAVFCDLLVASTATPPRPLPLVLRVRERRGGAEARRLRRTPL